jgi:hypothetical protein
MDRHESVKKAPQTVSLADEEGVKDILVGKMWSGLVPGRRNRGTLAVASAKRTTQSSGDTRGGFNTRPGTRKNKVPGP